MTDETETLTPISAIQHYIYCRRRCYLVQAEQLWSENRYTAEGRVGHENVDNVHHEKRPAIYRTYRLQLVSNTLGLTGYADLVEFFPDDGGVLIPSIHKQQKVIVVPVEYKRGTAKDDTAYRLQLCAQALCLEEMFGASIPIGYLYEVKKRHRIEIPLTEEIRNSVVSTIRSVRSLLASPNPPHAEYETKCKHCSMSEVCMPKLMENTVRGSRYWSTFYSKETKCENS
jgi:CRISPR-associated exonuclease Cas4